MADGKVVISTKLDNSGFTNGISGLKNSIKSFAATVGIAFGTVALVNFGKESVKVASEMKSAFTGLQSIVKGQGRSFTDTKAFIQDYISDGLIPATNAVTAYKNLAMRGYDDKQIQEVMIALKDSSAYGRQAALTMGEAVTSATEGLKNENSILVDNAGVTKNVSIMWKDYAKSIGVGVDSLTQQQKIQAEVNGILHETRFQTSDAAKVAGDYAGQVLGLKFAVNDFKIALGNMIIPITQVVIPAFKAMINAATRLINIFGQVTGALFGTTATGQQEIADSANAAAGAEEALGAATKKAGKEAKGSLGSFDELNVLQKDTEAGADGGAGAVGGGGGMVVPPADTTEGEGALSEAAQRILALLEPLRQINFDNLSAAFGRLKEAVAPLGKSLFAGLEWAYENIFVPFAKWTIEEAAPAFLDALAKAAEALSKALDALKPMGIWLWDNFLQPLASWSGEWFIAMLEGIQKDFEDLGNWIGENPKAFETFAIVLGSFALAWGLVTVAIGLWNIVGPIATTVLGILNGTLVITITTVGWVVIAIAAVIAIIVLLIKNWDDVKAFALGCWEAIKACWDVVAEWFNTNVAQPVVQFFTGLWDGIKALALSCWEAIVACWNIVAEWFSSTVVEPVAQFFTGLWDGIKSMAATCWDVVKTCWKAVSGWFDKTVVQPVAKFFTDLWDGIVKAFNIAWEGMSDGFKGYINGWFDILEGFANFVVNMMNKIIDAINSISVEIPDLGIFGDLAGTTFGFNISHIPPVKLPRLAQGAVIPANREFMAVLGDQKHGTNLEAPADLIRQIVREETAGLAQQSSQPIEVEFILDGDVLYRKMIDVKNRQGYQIGGAFANAY